MVSVAKAKTRNSSARDSKIDLPLIGHAKLVFRHLINVTEPIAAMPSTDFGLTENISSHEITAIDSGSLSSSEGERNQTKT